eukprot:TRINITY_DN81806_c0_g1_i1.p1 TRINITY_DN81806_c0_g1~~TRINITY_DN81806_c0_g1_i1.p1  ORF type:complete len:697 (+),score=140.60 TRINITY_DN81806_c0_g1_i1:122-2212(+)
MRDCTHAGGAFVEESRLLSHKGCREGDSMGRDGRATSSRRPRHQMQAATGVLRSGNSRRPFATSVFVAASVSSSFASVGAEPSRPVTSADCWVGGWTPEVCCSAPGAKGNPLCWDHVFTYDKCCTETEEGIQFDLRRRNFVSDMVRRGATVHFDIRHVSGGRTGAVASQAMSARSTVLRVPATQVYSLKSVPATVEAAARQHACDAHAVLALGLAMERANPTSTLTEWIKLLPLTFANVLWFTDRQLELVNSSFFGYIVENWFGDLQCMQRAAETIPATIWRGRQVQYEDLRWALSVVKTRGFAFEGTRESTMLIPLADFLNHNMVASVRTATLAEDALRFVATRNIMPGEELCIDYAQASNMEFLVRYGFRVEDNPYGGRQFDLGGEPLQAHCPMYILRYDTPDIIENATVDCHRQARYLSFEQQFGTIHLHEQLREDRYIYKAVEEACEQLLSMLRPPRPLPEYEESEERGRGTAVTDGITSVLLKEIRAERVLLERCVVEFRRRQNEPEPRPVPATLAEPLARLRGQGVGSDDEAAAPPPSTSAHAGMTEESSTQWSQRTPPSAASASSPGLSRAGDSGMDASGSYGAGMGGYDPYAGSRQATGAYGNAGPAAGFGRFGGGGGMAGAVPPGTPTRPEQGILSSFGASPGSFGMGSPVNTVTAGIDAGGRFSTMVDRSKVDNLLQRLQAGASLS